ncbi:MAG TPA: hypothetical protein VFA76_16835 [Terriglobales bacterium]|nr:hypothetical protein [Terriglobales bacterium]
MRVSAQAVIASLLSEALILAPVCSLWGAMNDYITAQSTASSRSEKLKTDQARQGALVEFKSLGSQTATEVLPE